MPLRQVVQAWIVFAAAYVVSVSATTNQFKVPPALPVIIDAFGLDLTAAGLMMSMFAVVGIFLALPAGLVLRWWGPRRVGTLACLFLMAGGGIGVISNTSWGLLASRAVEGIGMGLIAVAMPTVISMWFSEDRRGLPMGLWATWVPIGSIVMYNMSPVLIAAYSWRSVWWLAAGFSTIASLLCWLVVRPPASDGDMLENGSSPIGFREGLVQILTCSEIWRVSVAFLPVFLTTTRGFSLSDAGFTVSLIMSTTLFSSPLAGWLSDRFGSRRMVFALPFLLLAFMLTFAFATTRWQIPTYMILFGAVAGGIPMAAFSLVPDVVPDQRLVGVGMALVVMGQNAGMVIGPVLFGSLAETLGWSMAGKALVPIALLGFGVAWKIKIRQCVSPIIKNVSFN